MQVNLKSNLKEKSNADILILQQINFLNNTNWMYPTDHNSANNSISISSNNSIKFTEINENSNLFDKANSKKDYFSIKKLSQIPFNPESLSNMNGSRFFN